MKKLKKTGALTALVAVNLAIAAIYGSRLFGQTGVQVYSTYTDASNGVWTNRQTTTFVAYFLGLCSNPGNDPTFNLCWKRTSSPASAPRSITLNLNGGGTRRISGEIVPVSWQTSTYANYPNQ